MLQFLENSKQYTAENILSNFPSDSLLEERAIILGRLGKHEQALMIYVRALGDIQKASNYCKKVYEKNIPGSQSVRIPTIYVSIVRFFIIFFSYLSNK